MDLFPLYKEVIGRAENNSYFDKCGFVACNNLASVCGNVLITGINPSVPVNGQYVPTASYDHPFTTNTNSHFQKLCKFVPEKDRDSIGYLDIFPFYERSQDTLLSNIRGNEPFIASVLAVTQEAIEKINPSLLIIANKGTWPFWGAVQDCVWMGYDFVIVAEDDLPEQLRGRKFDIRIIRGFRKDSKAVNEIIYRPYDGICQLKGTLALMYKHNSALSAEEQISTEDYLSLLAYAKQVKTISKYL